MKTIKLADLGISAGGERCVIELPNGEVLDIELQRDNELWVDYRSSPDTDSHGCLPINLNH
jgi:hypothetical protein